MSPLRWIAVAMITAGVLCLAAGAGRAWGHDWYSDKKSNHPDFKGWLCCNTNPNKPDCKPVSAWLTPEGTWQFRYPDDGNVYDVPPEVIHPDNENPEPFQASACVYQGQVLCFWRSAPGG